MLGAQVSAEDRCEANQLSKSRLDKRRHFKLITLCRAADLSSHGVQSKLAVRLIERSSPWLKLPLLVSRWWATLQWLS